MELLSFDHRLSISYCEVIFFFLRMKWDGSISLMIYFIASERKRLFWGWDDNAHLCQSYCAQKDWRIILYTIWVDWYTLFILSLLFCIEYLGNNQYINQWILFKMVSSQVNTSPVLIIIISGCVHILLKKVKD